MSDFDVLEEAGHDLSVVSGPMAGVSTYYCESCGALVLMRNVSIEVFHVPSGSQSSEKKCLPVALRPHEVIGPMLKDKLHELHLRDIERLRTT